MPGISAIVPAAGLSSRFGSANKLLQPWGDSTMVGQVCKVLAQAGLDVVVVTGHDAANVEAAVAPVRCVFNPKFAEGMGTSIARGVEASPEENSILIALADMPALDPETIQKLIRQLAAGGPDAIVAPLYVGEPGRTGHPVLFGSGHRAELLALKGDEGAKSVIRKHHGSLMMVPVRGALDDHDLPSDLPS